MHNALLSVLLAPCYLDQDAPAVASLVSWSTSATGIHFLLTMKSEMQTLSVKIYGGDMCLKRCPENLNPLPTSADVFL